MSYELTEGTKVHYCPSHGVKENGIVKNVGEANNVFVVFKCAEDWDNYKDYTGQSTSIYDLKYGWVDRSGKLIEEPILPPNQ